MNWRHLLWIIPIALAVGYYLGALMGTIKLDRAKAKWNDESVGLISRRDLVVTQLRSDIYNLTETNANLRRRCKKYELGED